MKDLAPKEMFDEVMKIFLESCSEILLQEITGVQFFYNSCNKKFTLKSNNGREISSYLRTCCIGHMGEDLQMTLIQGLKIAIKMNVQNVHVVLPYETE